MASSELVEVSYRLQVDVDVKLDRQELVEAGVLDPLSGAISKRKLMDYLRFEHEHELPGVNDKYEVTGVSVDAGVSLL